MELKNLTQLRLDGTDGRAEMSTNLRDVEPSGHHLTLSLHPSIDYDADRL